MNPLPHTHWRVSAAYLYILTLDNPDLAWEYLRRNPGYARDWRRRARGQSAPDPARWGLIHLLDPSVDARSAHPAWNVDPGSLIHVLPDFDPLHATVPFSLWRIAGRRTLVHEGRRLLLVVRRPGSTLRLALPPDIEEGNHCVHIARRTSRRRIWNLGEHIRSMEDTTPFLARERPDRRALTHMRSLQALDALREGASQRQIAEVLFGHQHVAARWHPDSELRARVRYLVQRGRRAVYGGYRQLIGSASTEQGE